MSGETGGYWTSLCWRLTANDRFPISRGQAVRSVGGPTPSDGYIVEALQKRDGDACGGVIVRMAASRRDL